MCMQFWQGSCGSWPAFCETLGQFLLVVMVQGGQLMSFGRATYGRAGRLDVDPKGDDSNPEARPVDNLDGATVRVMAAGEVHPPPPPSAPCLLVSMPLLYRHCLCIWMQPARHACRCLPHACSPASISIVCLAYLGVAVEVKLTLMQ